MAAVLVTRSEPGASETAERLRDLGHAPLVAPMLRIAPLTTETELGGVQALLFTSANGVRAFAAAPELPALCVGSATADAARRAGFATVLSAEGNGTALADLVRLALQPDLGPLLHARGEDVAGDLAGALADAGFAIRESVVYRAVPAESLGAEVEAALASDALDAVLFHSARAAEAFCALAPAAPLARLHALCLSERVAAAARAGAWGRVAVPKEPTEDLLLALLPHPDSPQT